MFKGNFVFTSESVTEGHPDKICDQISDAILDEVYKKNNPKENNFNCRVACETFITSDTIIVGGEINTKEPIDVVDITKNVLKNIGYNDKKYGFDYKNCKIINFIRNQSVDISRGILHKNKEIGAGDQGIMFGYACDETEELMPAPIMFAHKLTMQLSYLRKNNILPYLGPDGKSQVSIKYVNNIPVKIEKIVISTQHTNYAVDPKTDSFASWARNDIIEKVILPVIPKELLKNFNFDKDCYINPTGKFVIGGPASDTGMTGRKIIVDTYGGMAPHGGGAFSGKDPTKVDRSAAYMARYIAKNIVSAKIAKKCLVQLAYAIGIAEPLSVMIETFGTSKISNQKIVQLVKKVFPLTPKGIIYELKLYQPIYQKTASYGHFGRNEFTWEKTNKIENIKEFI